jgi:hypothetical protein
MSKSNDEMKPPKVFNDVQTNSEIGRLVKNRVIKACEPFLVDKINLKEQNKQRILECVGAELTHGKPTGRIVSETGLSRDTVYDLGLELIKEGSLIKYRKHGNYILAPESMYGNQKFFARKFTEEIMQMVSKHPAFRFQYFCINNRFGSTALRKRINYLKNQDYTLLHDKPDEKTEMEAILVYEFANRIGALTSYLLICSLKFYSKSAIEVGKKSIPIVDSIDRLILDWLNAALSPHILLNEFHKFMDRERAFTFGEEILRRTKKPELVPPPSPKVRNNPKSKTRELQHWSFYQIEPSVIERLSKAFEEVYPDLFKNAEDIRRKLPDEINKRLEDAQKWGNEIENSESYRELQEKRKRKKR